MTFERIINLNFILLDHPVILVPVTLSFNKSYIHSAITLEKVFPKPLCSAHADVSKTFI